MGAGLVQLRRARARLAVQGTATYGSAVVATPVETPVYFLVPCLNEEAVIGQTVAGLTKLAGTTTVVIDDGSDDHTARCAEQAGGFGVEVLRRDLPEARRGKGEALNAGVAWVRRRVAELGQDPEQVIVCVMDADGRLSDGALDHVLPLFADEKVGGVQLQVRIRNRGSFLTRFQDYQFWAIAAVTQFGRQATGTVSLGGNGQFARLSALNMAGEKPWSASLTEDLDLAITLALQGWELQSTPHASVDQQAVERLGPLVRQRTRWYQGHMMAILRLPEIWRSRELSHGRALELTSYCLVPWLLDLPWSILFHYCLIMLVLRWNDLSILSSGDGTATVIIAAAFYLLAFAPALATGLIYHRRDRRWGLLKSLAMGNAVIVTNYLSFACVWRALFRILRGQTSWDKTSRIRETGGQPSPAATGAAAAVAPVLSTQAGVDGAGEWKPSRAKGSRLDRKRAQ
nr:glycosyltransferase [Jiangella mangrovi]